MYRKGREGAADSTGNTEAELVSRTEPAVDGLTIISSNHCAVVSRAISHADPLPRRLNKSPATLDEPAVLKKMLTEPPVKKIDLHFPLGLEVTARNMKGVTIKDALDAIHKQFKKKV